MKPWVKYVLLAEFDINTGSTVRHQYPNVIPGYTPDWFAENMLPEGAHNREVDYTFMFLNRKSYSPDSEQVFKSKMKIETQNDKDEDEFLFGVNLVKTKHDMSVKRGAVVKALAVFSPLHIIECFKEILEIALDNYYQTQSINSLSNLYSTLNSIDISQIPSPTLLEKAFFRRSLVVNPVNDSSLQQLKLNCFHSFDISFEGFLSNVTIPLASFPDEYGNISVINLIQIFGESVMKIYDAILSKQRVLFVGYNHAASDVASIVLSSIALCCPAIFPLLPRVFPYANLSDLEFLNVEGYIAGVTNPMFSSRTQWWDVLCVLDLPNGVGTVQVAEKEDQDNKKSKHGTKRRTLPNNDSQNSLTASSNAGASQLSSPAVISPVDSESASNSGNSNSTELLSSEESSTIKGVPGLSSDFPSPIATAPERISFHSPLAPLLLKHFSRYLEGIEAQNILSVNSLGSALHNFQSDSLPIVDDAIRKTLLSSDTKFIQGILAITNRSISNSSKAADGSAMASSQAVSPSSTNVDVGAIEKRNGEQRQEEDDNSTNNSNSNINSINNSPLLEEDWIRSLFFDYTMSMLHQAEDFIDEEDWNFLSMFLNTHLLSSKTTLENLEKVRKENQLKDDIHEFQWNLLSKYDLEKDRFHDHLKKNYQHQAIRSYYWYVRRSEWTCVSVNPFKYLPFHDPLVFVSPFEDGDCCQHHYSSIGEFHYLWSLFPEPNEDSLKQGVIANLLRRLVRLLQTSKNLNTMYVLVIYYFLDGWLQKESHLQALLVLLPELEGGISLLVMGLFHPNDAVQYHACRLLKKIQSFSSTASFVDKLNSFYKLSFQRHSQRLGADRYLQSVYKCHEELEKVSKASREAFQAWKKSMPSSSSNAELIITSNPITERMRALSDSKSTQIDDQKIDAVENNSDSGSNEDLLSKLSSSTTELFSNFVQPTLDYLEHIPEEILHIAEEEHHRKDSSRSISVEDVDLLP